MKNFQKRRKNWLRLRTWRKAGEEAFWAKTYIYIYYIYDSTSNIIPTLHMSSKLELVTMNGFLREISERATIRNQINYQLPLAVKFSVFEVGSKKNMKKRTGSVRDIGRPRSPAAAAHSNETLLDSGIATLARAVDKDNMGQLEGTDG